MLVPAGRVAQARDALEAAGHGNGRANARRANGEWAGEGFPRYPTAVYAERPESSRSYQRPSTVSEEPKS
jgi:hypothetical protein